MCLSRRDGRRATWPSIGKRSRSAWIRASGIGRGSAPARDWAVANRDAVLSTSVALLVGLVGRRGAWARVARRACVRFRAAWLDRRRLKRARSANAPRAGLPQVDGMAFVRLRAEMDQADPRACLEFSQNLSTDRVDQLRRLSRDGAGRAVPSRRLRQSAVPGRLAVRAGAPSHHPRRPAVRCRASAPNTTRPSRSPSAIARLMSALPAAA